MFTKNIYYDKFAIVLSLLCTLHCLALPLLILLLPTVSTVFLADESVHFYMVMMVLPISSFALWIGYKEHGSTRILLQGIFGLLLLSITVLLGHEQLGEVMEKLLTVLGSGFVCYAHYLNYKNCQRQENCDCHYSNGIKQEENMKL